MAEDLFHVEDVFCFVLFHCGFPMAECVACYLVESWVFEFSGYPSTLSGKVPYPSICIVLECFYVRSPLTSMDIVVRQAMNILLFPFPSLTLHDFSSCN